MIVTRLLPRREWVTRSGPDRGRRRTKSRSASHTARHSHLWGARNPRVPWSSTSILDDPCDSGGVHGRSGPNPPHGASSGWLLILPWRLGAVHEFIGTQAATRNSGSGHEKVPLVRTPWEALSVVSSVAPTLSTATPLESVLVFGIGNGF